MTQMTKMKKVIKIEASIKSYYTKQYGAPKIRLRVKWLEDGEKPIRFFFDLEKKEGKKSYEVASIVQT